MLAALLCNLPTNPGGPDAQHYYRLRRQRQRREAFQKAEHAEKIRLAKQAYEVARKVKPEAAAQVIQPFIAKPTQESRRYEVNWTLVIESIVSYDCLCALMVEIEDEEILAILSASES